MRRLFRSEGLNPRNFSLRELLPLLKPSEWDTLFWLLLPVIGAIVAACVTALWVLHFASSGSWGSLILTVSAAIFVCLAASLRFAWAAYALAVVAGLGAAVVLSGNVNVFIP